MPDICGLDSLFILVSPGLGEIDIAGRDEVSSPEGRVFRPEGPNIEELA